MTTTIPPGTMPAGADPSGADPSGTSFARATRLVAEREVTAFLRMKSFWIGLGVLVVGLFALAVLPSVFGGAKDSVAVVGSAGASVLTGADVEVREVADLAAAQALVRAEEVDAAIIPDTSGASATGVRVLALSDPPTDVIAALNTAPPVDLLDPSDVGSGQRQLVIMVFSLLFLIFGMGGTAIAQSTVTEKQTRIVEILVATVPVRALLAGKILGHTAMTLGQVVILAVATPIALAIGGQSELLAVIAPAVGWFVPFMVLGFVLLAAMWGVAGSLVSRQEDLGSTMGPMVMLVMGPYFLVMFLSDNATAMTVLSFVPFSAAIAMPVRMFAGEAAAWEALLSLGVLAATVALVLHLSTRVFSGSLLRTGAKVALSSAWRSEPVTPKSRGAGSAG